MDNTTDTAEQPFYVNAKQYHRILKRRIARARLEETLKSMPGRRPYLHESRHKHAMRRPRGQGGRFLTAAEIAEREQQEKEAQANGSSSANADGSQQSAPSSVGLATPDSESNDSSTPVIQTTGTATPDTAPSDSPQNGTESHQNTKNNHSTDANPDEKDNSNVDESLTNLIKLENDSDMT